MKKLFDARIMLILSMAVFGTIGYFKRNIAVSSGELALYRAVLAAVFIGLFLLITNQKIPFGKIKKQIPLLALSGVAMGFNWILLFEAYENTTVSIATISYYFAPVIVMLACPLLFKEKMGLKQWICFAMSSVGIVLISVSGESEEGNNHLLGIIFGLGAACLYATVILINKFIKSVDGIHRTFLQFIAAIVVLVPYVLMTDGITLGGLDAKGWVFLLIIGFVHTGITYCLYFSSLKELSGQKAAVLSYIDPLVAVLCSCFLLQESMEVWQIIGAVLVFGFTLLNEIDIKKLNLRRKKQ